ncbi:MAG: sensor histidine kinase [Akkermansiaceae bacterium]
MIRTTYALTMLRLPVCFFLLVFSSLLGGKEHSPFLARSWKSDEGLTGNVARSVGQSSDGYLWVAASEGVARFDGLEFLPVPAAGKWNGVPLLFFRVFTPSDGSVWVSTSRGGLFRVEDGELHCVIEEPRTEGARRFTHLFIHEGQTYLVRAGALHHLENNEVSIVSSPDEALRMAFEEELAQGKNRGRVAGAVPPQELLTRDGGKWQIGNARLIFHQPDEEKNVSSIGFERGFAALDLLEDREGNLWVASRGLGLIQIQPKRVSALTIDRETYDHAVITAMHTREDEWWIARSSGGVDRVSNGELEHLELYASNILRIVVAMLEDRTGRLWFATRNGSVFYRDGEEFVAAYPRLGMSKINAMTEDSKGRIWFGGRGSLFRRDGEKIDNLSSLLPTDEGEIETITTIVPGPDETLWLGTMSGNLYLLDTEGDPRPKRFNRVGNVSNPHISSILPLKSGELWITTIRSGLYLWQEGQLNHFDQRDGLPDERLTGIHMIGDDEFWLGSLGGILRTSRSELIKWKRDGNTPPVWQRFDRSDGMPTRECIGGGQPGIIPAGEILWFPTTEGMAGISPAKVKTNPVPPTIHFKPVTVDGVSQPISSEGIKAGPGGASIGFHFTGLCLTSPEEVTYQVKMQGIDDAPRMLGTQREVTYAALPPGNYTFEVTATNGDGISTPNPKTILVSIEPHFWQEPWFLFLSSFTLLAGALGIGAFIMRRRTRRKLEEIRLHSALQNERSRISRDLHDDLGASLTELFILTELTAENTQPGPEVDNLKELSLKSKRAVGALDEIVWATSPEQDNLRSLVEYLSFFASDFLKSTNIRLLSDIATNIPEVEIGPRRRHHVVLTMREALNNAVKYAETDRVHLQVTLKQSQLQITLRDEGRGFDPKTISGGNGLSNMQKRMSDCGGNCRIESSPKEGTTVTLTMPLPPA